MTDTLSRPETMVERVARAIWAERRVRVLGLGGFDLLAWEEETHPLHESVRMEALAAINEIDAYMREQTEAVVAPDLRRNQRKG